MKITKYKPFIKEQLQPIQSIYDLTINKGKSNEYIIFIENKHIEIELYTIYREEGSNSLVKDKKQTKTYTLGELIELKTSNNNYLSELDRANCKSFNDSVKVMIY